MKGKLLTVLFFGATLLPLTACGGSTETAPTTPAESPAMSPSMSMSPSPAVTSPSPAVTSPSPTTSP
jgi:hypothetical protein